MDLSFLTIGGERLGHAPLGSWLAYAALVVSPIPAIVSVGLVVSTATGNPVAPGVAESLLLAVVFGLASAISAWFCFRMSRAGLYKVPEGLILRGLTEKGLPWSQISGASMVRSLRDPRQIRLQLSDGTHVTIHSGYFSNILSLSSSEAVAQQIVGLINAESR